MFSIAKVIVRNKVGVVALVALGVVLFAPKEEEQGPSHPWAVGANQPAVAAAEETGIIDGVMDEAGELLAETGIDPIGASEENAERMEGVATAFQGADAN